MISISLGAGEGVRMKEMKHREGEIDLRARARKGETIVLQVNIKTRASEEFVEGLEKLGAGQRLLDSARGMTARS
jgi:hypothetical protein